MVQQNHNIPSQDSPGIEEYEGVLQPRGRRLLEMQYCCELTFVQRPYSIFCTSTGRVFVETSGEGMKRFR